MEPNKNEVKYGGKGASETQNKSPGTQAYRAGATQYRRWLALGPFGGATPIIETKNEALMRSAAPSLCYYDVASGLQSPEDFGAIGVSRGGRFDSRG